ncbi:phage tail terminator protein [Pasteurella testudinis]|uniref:phage tail terminator protein n=1 Tax=Pasteurella testudinis TaxID=761 RepID=UPI0040583914
MNIHKTVRKDVIDLLAANLGDVKHFYSSTAYFSNLEDQLPAISVSISSASCEPVGFGTTEWNGTLNISIFLPLFEGEDRLDDIAEQINRLLKVGYGYKSIRQIRPGCEYDYEFDTEQYAWKSATLSYSIDYGEQRTN